jgi:Mg/Co/Ni transporter MgtE
MHHVYIVDQHKVPLGVISVSDICRLLDRECCKQ